MKRVLPKEVRDRIGAGKIAGPTSQSTRGAYRVGIHETVHVGKDQFLTPVVYGAAVHDLLRGLARTLDPTTGKGHALHLFLSRSPAAFTQFCRRNKAWLAREIEAAKEEKGLTP